MSGVRYPIDFFVKRFYDQYYPNEIREAMDAYRRVNSTLDLKLDHLEKYAAPNPFECSSEEIDTAVVSIFQEMKANDEYIDMISEIRDNVTNRAFFDLNVDGSSAAGFPFDQGVKRRDVQLDAVIQANAMLDDPVEFDAYARDHVWYSTGRARMIAQDKDDKGRLILYAGFSYMLIAMLFVQPFC
jgi:hypothetical protein